MTVRRQSKRELQNLRESTVAAVSATVSAPVLAEEPETYVLLDSLTKKELLAAAEEEGLEVNKRLNKTRLLDEVKGKMPLSNNPKYI